jgi:hypothetical protein
MFRRIGCLLSAVCLSGWLAVSATSDTQYTNRFARLSLIEGHTSFQHSGDTDWAAASINMTLQPGDRIYTGDDGRAEIEFDDGSVLHLAEKADVEILALKDDLIQLRVLLGLETLTVASGVTFEINTPAAAFTTVRKGVYRIDVHENGDSDAIVRKGAVEAAGKEFSRRIDSGDLIHVTAGEQSTQTVARYTMRDPWDEWTDRRTADRVAHDSRKYLPAYVNVGVSDLDRYGRWVTVEDYGPGWVPASVDAGWSPYWDGRWVYRPYWGWTWVSYEPWGWLPYHYGRWHWNAGLGWAWLPGASFGFHFWSPGLVRFYHGSNSVSWCALGPGDYYHAGNFYYHPTYNYYLNDMRLQHRRGPGDLSNRNAPGAFRTVRTDHFTNGSYGARRDNPAVDGGDRPSERGRMINDRLDVTPTSRSFAPAPDRAGVRSVAPGDRPVVVRNEPAVEAGSTTRYTRLPNREAAAPAGAVSRGDPGSAVRGTDASAGTAAPRIWNRYPATTGDPGSATGTRTYQTPRSRSIGESPAPAPSQSSPSGDPGAGRRYERSMPDRTAPPASRPSERSAPERSAPSPGRMERSVPERSAPSPGRMDRSTPDRSTPDRTAPSSGQPERSAPERKPPERSRPERSPDAAYVPRAYRGSATVQSAAPVDAGGASGFAARSSYTSAGRSDLSAAAARSWGSAPTSGSVVASGRSSPPTPGGVLSRSWGSAPAPSSAPRTWGGTSFSGRSGSGFTRSPGGSGFSGASRGGGIPSGAARGGSGRSGGGSGGGRSRGH